MQVLSKLLGCKDFSPEPHSTFFVTDDRLGIEIELEGFDSADFEKATKLSLWSIKEDGSLRNNGVEFVTNGGIGGKRLEAAIDEVVGFLDKTPFNASWRCSTHMHVNMLDFNMEQILKYILAYICVEPVMFDFCEASRRQSNFCVLLSNSLVQTREMLHSVHESWPVHRVRGVKYMALNILPLGNENLGTVEFRGSHALTTKDELCGLAQRLLSIKRFVRDFSGSVDDMLTAIQQEGWKMVLTHGIPEAYVGSEFDIERAQMLAWACWKFYQKRGPGSPQQTVPMPDIQAAAESMRRRAGNWFVAGDAGPNMPPRRAPSAEDMEQERNFFRLAEEILVVFVENIRRSDYGELSDNEQIVQCIGAFASRLADSFGTRIQRKLGGVSISALCRAMIYQYIPNQMGGPTKEQVVEAIQVGSQSIFQLLSDFGHQLGATYRAPSSVWVGAVAAGIQGHIPEDTRSQVRRGLCNYANFKIPQPQHFPMVFQKSHSDICRIVINARIRMINLRRIQEQIRQAGIGATLGMGGSCNLLTAFSFFQTYAINSSEHIAADSRATYNQWAPVLAWMLDCNINFPQTFPYLGLITPGRISVPRGIDIETREWARFLNNPANANKVKTYTNGNVSVRYF